MAPVNINSYSVFLEYITLTFMIGVVFVMAIIVITVLLYFIKALHSDLIRKNK